MTSRTVDARTLWAVLAMEAALVLPAISLPTQGDRLLGMPGPVLLLALLPLGYAAVYELRSLRDPSWRLLTGIGLALLTRLIVSSVPEQGLLVWLGRSFVPAAIGVALWWRGGALAVAELTPTDVRTEFSVIAICLVGALSLVRPFLLPDPLLLGGSVALFVVGGLVGTALSRQAAADVAPPRSSATLASVTSLVPAGVAVVLVGFLRPELLGTMWFLLARAIELALTPIGLLLAWLSSLFPRAPAGPPPTPLPQPTLPPMNTDALTEAQDRLAWLAMLVIVTLLVAAGIATLIAARLLLANWIRDPRERERAAEPAAVEVERSGAPSDEAADLFGWLMRWLRERFGGGSAAARARPRASSDERTVDAWAAYQRLLSWAERRGLGRRPSETTGQLAARLARYAPESAAAVDLVTHTYEWQRYGAVRPASDRLRQVQAALAALVEPPER